MAISEQQINACFDVGTALYRGEISIDVAKKHVADTTGMSQGSAQDYIYNVGYLLNGKTYKRTMSAVGTEIFLRRIVDEFGHMAGKTAVQSVLDHVEYYSGLKTGGNHRKIRELAEKWRDFLHLLPPKSNLDLEYGSFQIAVQESLRDKSTDRLARLSISDGNAAPYSLQTIAYHRNPDVVAEALSRSKGCCEHCGKEAPFLRTSDATYYLEVHHILPLSRGGKDALENVTALCPNCHRHAHFGLNWTGK